MLRNLLCHSNDTGKSGMFFFQIRIFDGEMFNFLVTFISFKTLRVIQVFNSFKCISGSIWIIFIGIANKLDTNAFATLEENDIMESRIWETRVFTFKVSIRHSRSLGTTANISAGQFGSDTTAQLKFKAARLMSGSASPVTSLPANDKESLAMGTKASPADDARVANVSRADDWRINVDASVSSRKNNIILISYFMNIYHLKHRREVTSEAFEQLLGDGD